MQRHLSVRQTRLIDAEIKDRTELIGDTGVD